MGCSCSKSTSVGIVEERRPVRKLSGKDGRPPTGAQGQRRTDGKGPLKEDNQAQVKATVHEDSTGRSAQTNDKAYTTSFGQKTQETSTKIPDIDVFKDLDRRASQAPEGHATIKDLVLYLIETAKTPLEKARVLFRWVTSHVQYDVVSYVTGGPKEVTPDGVFRKRMSVCQGYADLYKEMCRFAVVNCVTISGRSKGGSYEVGDKFGPNSDHAWNAVEIDGRWYLIDCTWAAGNTDLQKKTFEFKYNEHYFFTDPEVFVTDHHPMDNKWQLEFFPAERKQLTYSFDMGSSCSKSRSANVVEGQRPVKNGRQLTSTLPQDRQPAGEQNRLHNEPSQDSVLKIRQTNDGGDNQELLGAAVHGVSKETTDPTTEEQTSNNTVAELQETIGEQDDQEAAVRKESKETTDITAEEQTKEQTSPNNERNRDTVAELKETIGEHDDQRQAEGHEDLRETTDDIAVEQKKNQTTPDPCKDNDAEVQETIGEQSDQAEVHEDSADHSVQKNKGVDTTVMESKTPRPRAKKDLIPDLEVFKDLDERAVQAPEGHATIKNLVLYLIETAKTPLEKARVLFRWVTSHVQYDVVALVTGGPKEVRPDGVFRKRMSVCQGYADLYKEMCRFAEVNCVTVSGRSKGGSYQVGDKFGPNSDHAWNAVKIDGKWHLLDCTWAAGNSDLQKRTFEFEYNEHYFFTDPEVFPLDGRLAANRRVHFRVVFPNAVEVVVIANGKWHKLVRNADDSWEGDADTGEQGKIIQVATKDTGGKSYSTLLQYEVVAYM
ncbi:KY [Branchiostoma lanceolatum]|uniref:KY protein n=1 Tax=Branchiostoma lanceolatum TaxID=7740 RepID=A0A8K0EDK6_BRALA|nr:KY [Branchiostoma lanceolatum]